MPIEGAIHLRSHSIPLSHHILLGLSMCEHEFADMSEKTLEHVLMVIRLADSYY